MNPIIVEAVLPIPFDAFWVCVYSRRRKLEISYVVISLVYGRPFPTLPCFYAVMLTVFLEDLFAFFAILRLPGRWAVRRFGLPGLLGTILKDATKYFLVIFTAHLTLAMTLLFAKVGLTMYIAIHNNAERFL